MNDPIAIVGMACLYADARSPAELWENVLAQRRAFRRLPAERLSLDDYLDADPAAPDRTYSAEAAVLTDYEFDRVRFRVAGPTFRSVDLAHWVALDVADRALRDAGFPDGAGLPSPTTGVLVGNTLTGEFSRASTLRLRWPYVRRTVRALLRSEGWDEGRLDAFLEALEERYKSPFPPADEDSLAGSLSNTIAGRICSQFDLGGGGYTVDGACCSSLLAVAHGCFALASGDLDVVVAGGVDLSLDPFELVGFAKVGALARGEMKVYDRHSSGFLPGEGCGFVVLMRHADAQALGRRPYAAIHGWGLSSDGAGAITRPNREGQIRALERAYRRAGYGIHEVELFEGHGTGTPVGDEVELRAIVEARRRAGGGARPAAVGSVKANVGHTKAAAGVAGLLKAACAVHHGVLPPTTGVDRPRPEVWGPEAPLRVLREGQPWPDGGPRRAGVSAFGFGGINVHVTLESCTADAAASPPQLTVPHAVLCSSAQDAEGFFLDAADARELASRVEALRQRALHLSRAELADVAAVLASRQRPGRPARAGVVATTPRELHAGLSAISRWLAEEVRFRLDVVQGAFLGLNPTGPRVLLLFPGQASPVRVEGGAMERRFPRVRAAYDELGLRGADDLHSTRVAQPAIATGARVGLALLSEAGVEGWAAVGNSLGELAALHWAGAMDGEALLRLTRARGEAMSLLDGRAGAMASLACGQDEARALLHGVEGIVIACLNSPRQTVVSGRRSGVATVMARARERGVAAVELPTSHAFHSPLMDVPLPAFDRQLRATCWRPLQRRAVSTVTGGVLPPDADLPRLLAEQVTRPVRLMEALERALAEADLCVEVGPGQVLTRVVQDLVGVPAVSLDVGGDSLRGLLVTAAAAHALGAPVRARALFDGRFTRSIDLDRAPRFLASPCEKGREPEPAADGDGAARGRHLPPPPPPTAILQEPPPAGPSGPDPVAAATDVLRALVEERAELPAGAVSEQSRLRRDLHLNSMAVGELVSVAARRLGLPGLDSPLEVADATLGEVAAALCRAAAAGIPAAEPAVPEGVESWSRAFAVRLRAAPRGPDVRPQAPRTGPWEVHGEAGPLVAALQERSARWPGSGAVVCLAGQPSLDALEGLLCAARGLALGCEDDRRLVVVQEDPIADAFVRTLHLEHPEIGTCVVQAPMRPAAAEWVEEEIHRMSGHTAVVYDVEGRRLERCLAPYVVPEAGGIPPLGPGDLVVASGGAKGIVAECARALARELGVRLLLVGRARPEQDAELHQGLERFREEGARFRYAPVDVADVAALQRVIAEAEEEWGPVRGILHGAGLNRPAPLAELDADALRRTASPKLLGFRHLLQCVDGKQLRLLVTFGSVIGRVGLAGQADYALANAVLTHWCRSYQASHPRCRCLPLEWSVWAEVGMGERLGRRQALRRQGIEAIPPATGTALFLRLVCADSGSPHGGPSEQEAAPALVVSGRLGAFPPLPVEGAALPLLRYLERPRVHYPGVELVCDAELCTASDPYLDDHVVQGRALLPAVLGLEAMAQGVQALTGQRSLPVFEGVSFDRPLAVTNEAITLRIAALGREDGSVEVVLRSSETHFRSDHFRARCRWPGDDGRAPERADPGPGRRVVLDPRRDLYGGLLFQTGRFARLRGYRELASDRSWAELAASAGEAWFGPYLPGELVLGDPGARDAAVHSIQACVPHALLLPVAIERVRPGVLPAAAPLTALARERWRRGDRYCFDLEIHDAGGRVCERWEGLTLQKAADAPASSWPPALLEPSVEWRVRDLLEGARVRVALAVEPRSLPDAPEATARALARLLPSARLTRRSDRVWRADGDAAVSAAHAEDVTLVVAGQDRVGCDLEAVQQRTPETWHDLLGPGGWSLAQAVAHQAGEDVHVSATRVWAAMESLKKAGPDRHGPLLLRACERDGWVRLDSAQSAVATYPVRLDRRPTLLVLAVCLSQPTCVLTNTGIESASRIPTS